jgi:tetratricopeptide (TPR) repeat protein
MQRGFRVFIAVAVVAAASLVIRADATPSSQASEIQLQLGDLLSSEGRFLDALDAYRNALKAAPADDARRPRIGVIMSALRVAEFDLARQEAEILNRTDPTNPQSMTLYADALWSSGLFQEAETLYEQALAASPTLARGHHGMAKALAARILAHFRGRAEHSMVAHGQMGRNRVSTVWPALFGRQGAV